MEDSTLTVRLRIKHDSPLQPLHHCSVGYQPSDNLIDLAEKAFPCKRIENTSKKTVNTQSEIADVYEANLKGVRALESKGLIDTVEEMQERGPWITVKGFVTTVTMIDLFLEGKLDTKQNPTLNNGGY